MRSIGFTPSASSAHRDPLGQSGALPGDQAFAIDDQGRVGDGIDDRIEDPLVRRVPHDHELVAIGGLAAPHLEGATRGREHVVEHLAHELVGRLADHFARELVRRLDRCRRERRAPRGGARRFATCRRCRRRPPSSPFYPDRAASSCIEPARQTPRSDPGRSTADGSSPDSRTRKMRLIALRKARADASTTSVERPRPGTARPSTSKRSTTSARASTPPVTDVTV